MNKQEVKTIPSTLTLRLAPAVPGSELVNSGKKEGQRGRRRNYCLQTSPMGQAGCFLLSVTKPYDKSRHPPRGDGKRRLSLESRTTVPAKIPFGQCQTTEAPASNPLPLAGHTR